MRTVPDATRPLRVDARRNRDRIVAAARIAFAERGVDIGVEEIARLAGVGMGTLYRRFPTKEALVLAIFEERLDELAGLAADVAALEPMAALEAFMTVACQQMGDDRGLLRMLAERMQPGPGADAIRLRYLAILEPFATRARAAGVVREDLDAEDLAMLLRMLGAATTADQSVPVRLGRGWEHYLQIVLAGMRAP